MSDTQTVEVAPSLYITLVSSLPPIEWLEGGAPLLGELSIKQRLSMVGHKERLLLAGISNTLLAIERSVTVPNVELEAWWQELSERSDCTDFKEFVDTVFRLRTLLAALKAKRDGSDDDSWGFHPIAAEIKRNWSQAQFGLERRWPELVMLHELVVERDGRALYEWWYAHLWNLTKRLDQQHLFDLEAVAFYLVRWRLATDFRSAGESGGRLRLMAGVEKIVSSEAVVELLQREQLRPLDSSIILN